MVYCLWGYVSHYNTSGRPSALLKELLWDVQGKEMGGCGMIKGKEREGSKMSGEEQAKESKGKGIKMTSCVQWDGQHACLDIPCTWSMQSILSSHYTPFLITFPGAGISVSCACVYLGLRSNWSRPRGLRASMSVVGGTGETRECVLCKQVCISVCNFWCASSWTNWWGGQEAQQMGIAVAISPGWILERPGCLTVGCLREQGFLTATGGTVGSGVGLWEGS